MVSTALYSRVVASFGAGTAPTAVDAVIELARCFGAELQAVLLEDVLTLALSEMPAPRTFDTRSAVWRDLQPTQLHEEMELAASLLRRRLETAQAIGVQARFTVVRGGAAAALVGDAQADDLLVIVEPDDAMARWVQPFAGLLDAALAAPSTVLYLPHRGRTRDGPVAVLGSSPATRELGRRLAQSLGAPLVAVEGDAALPGQTLHALLPLLRARRVRLVVCERAALAADARQALHEAGDQRVAVLLAPESARG